MKIRQEKNHNSSNLQSWLIITLRIPLFYPYIIVKMYQQLPPSKDVPIKYIKNLSLNHLTWPQKLSLCNQTLHRPQSLEVFLTSFRITIHLTIYTVKSKLCYFELMNYCCLPHDLFAAFLWFISLFLIIYCCLPYDSLLPSSWFIAIF